MLTLSLGVIATLVLTAWVYNSHVRDQVDQSLRGVTFAVEQTGQVLHFLEAAVGVVSSYIRDGRDSADVSGRFGSLLSSLEELPTILVLNGDGVVVADLRPGSEALGLDLSDQPYFRDALEASQGELVLNAPVVIRAGGQETYPFSMPVHDDNGVLLAVVVAMFESGVFDTIRQEFIGASDMQLLLVDQSRGVVAPLAGPKEDLGIVQRHVGDPAIAGENQHSWRFGDDTLIVAKSIADSMHISRIAKRPVSEIHAAALKIAILP